MPLIERKPFSESAQIGRTILKLCDNWLVDFRAWDEDCARVSRFYSGAVSESKEDQETLGISGFHTNYQPGRKVIENAFGEVFANFTQVQRLLSFKLKEWEGPPLERRRQEEIFSREVDRFLRMSDPRFLDECRRMCDRHVLHGDAVMFFPPRSHGGWRPCSAKLLTDIEAPQNVHDDNFSRWALMSDVQISEVMQGVKDNHEGWTSHAENYLRKEWERVYQGVSDGSAGTDFDRALTMYSALSPEEWEGYGQTGMRLVQFVTRRLKCWYFYQKDYSEAGKVPIDLHIVARFKGRDDETGDPLLYKRKAVYGSVGECLYEFILDGNLGVESSSWGTIKGLGHVNFAPDSMANMLLSVLNNSAIDRATPLWKAVDVTDLAMLQKWIGDGYRANSVLPAGMDLVEKGKNAYTVGDALALIGYLQSQGNENAVGHVGPGQGRKGELEVQALERQGKGRRVLSNRAVDFGRKLNAFCEELGTRLAGILHEHGPFSPLEPRLKVLHECLKDKNVELEWFYPENLVIGYVRLSGDGDPERRAMISEALMQRLAFIPGEAQSGVLLEWYATTTGDWDMAEAIYGQGDQGGVDLKVTAFLKIGAIMELGTPLPVTAEDVPSVVLPLVVTTMQAELSKAEVAGKFRPDKWNGFFALGRFGIMLVQKMESLGDGKVAGVFSESFRALAARAQKPYQGMLDAEEEGRVDVESARLELEDRKVGLMERRLEMDSAGEQARAISAHQKQVATQYFKSRAAMQNEERIDNDRLRLEKAIVSEQAGVAMERERMARAGSNGGGGDGE